MSAINQMFMGLFGAAGSVLSGLVSKWYPITSSEQNYLVRYINGKIWSFKLGTVVSVSTDGVNWEQIAPVSDMNIPANILLSDIAYGAGLYVMVGGTNSYPIIITSPDGITWTRRTTTYTLALTSVAWSPTLNLFVAATVTGVVLRSSDGVTWVTGAKYGTSSKKIIWAGGRFIITGATAQQILKSTDGITFTTSGVAGMTAGTSTDDIDYSPTLGLYALGGNSASIFTSTDATTWVARTTFGTSTVGIVWTGDKFVATTPTGVTTSTNGTTWATASIAGTTLTSLGKLCAIDNTTVVAVGNASAGTAISYNSGVTWGTSITEIATGNGQFRSAPATSINAITYSGGRYWASVTNVGGQMYYSTDKKVWYSTSLPASTTGTSYTAVYAGSAATPYWVSPGTTSTVGRVLTSTDGDTWVLRTVTTQGTSWNDAATNGTIVVMVNNGGQIATTTDGITFTNRTSGVASLRSIVYAGGKFVAVGSSAAVYSTDGITWTNASTSFGAFNAFKLIYNGTQFVVVGTGSATVNTKVSSDGITWATGPVAPWGTANVSSFAHNGSVHVAVTAAANIQVVYTGTSMANLAAVNLPITLTPAANGLVAVGTEFTLQSGITAFQLTSVDNGATWTVWETAEPHATNALGTHNHYISMLDDSLIFLYPYTGTGVPMFGKFNLATKSYTKISVNPAAGTLATFGVVKVGSTYIAGLGNNTTSGNISTSTDLRVWTTRLAPAATVRGFASNDDGSVIIAASHTGGITGILGVYRSIDGGTTWTRPTMPTAMNVNKVIWANNQFVAVGTNVSPAGMIQTSPDGLTWTTRFTGNTTIVFSDIAYGNGVYIAVSSGTSSKFYTSVDGVTWTPQGTTAFTAMSCIEFGNGEFKAVGLGTSNGGAAMYSTTNGTVYTTETPQYNSAAGLTWDGVDSFWFMTNRGSLYRKKVL